MSAIFNRENIRQSLSAALPIMLGYVAVGIPCGLLSASIGLNAIQVLMLSILFYSGAGQFMIPNMWLAGSPLASIVLSVSLVNTRQMLYSASFSRWCDGISRKLSFWFGATVTDESFGVNMNKFLEHDWDVQRATLVNEFSHASWTLSCVLGVLVGGLIDVPLAIASFAMTSIFICLLFTQKLTSANVVAALVAMISVFWFKAIGLANVAILFGALLGIAAAVVFSRVREASR